MGAVFSTTQTSTPRDVPASTQILVVGGGPAGSYAAAVLAREGFDVVLLEATKFPRYHIGESLLPSARPFLKFVGAEEDVKSYGFTEKPGGAVKLNQHKREGYTDFVARGPDGGTWNVIRSEFDDLLLKHAEKCGARVIQQTRVVDIHFSPTDPSHPVAASYISTPKSEDAPLTDVDSDVNKYRYQGKIRFDYLIHASGRNGIMSTRYLKNRRFNENLKNIAIWGYWTGVNKYEPGTSREGAIWVEALTDESGWVWYIPLHDGSTSIGVVLNEASHSYKRQASSLSLQDFYISQFKLAPGTLDLMGKGELRGYGKPDAVKSASDYSYSAPTYSGNHFRIAGDAGAFIDPFFSSGVHLAFTGGLSAAVTIAASIRCHASEEDAGKWHDAKYSTSYTRFLLVVLSVYRETQNQSASMMSDVGEDNFDRAFESLRPVIQGTADVGKVVTEDELQKTLEFIMHIFEPTNSDMQRSVFERIDPNLLAHNAPVLTKQDLDTILDPDDEDAQIVLANINAWNPIRPLLQPSQYFSSEQHFGRVAVLQTGKLGLTNVQELISGSLR